METLSLGNQQRVQLAAALTHDPELLVLDEPFASLDPVGVDALAEVLRERVDAGVVVVFSSHQLELVEQLCHEVGIIRAGQIVAAGPVDELRASGRSAQVRILVQAPPSWAEDPSLAAAGIRVVGVRREGDGLTETVLELSKPGDDQLVLDTARSARAVRVFAPERPSLADVFREAVGRAA